MKRFLIAFAVALVALRGFAGGPSEVVKFGPYNNITTNESTTVTNAPDGDRFYYGDLLGLYIDFGGAASPTVTVTLATTGDTGSGPARTLYTKALAADTWIPIRELVYSTTGTAATDFWGMIPLSQDKLRFHYATANVTNVNITAWVYIK